MTDTAAIRARHVPHTHDTDPRQRCGCCEQEWPCDAHQLGVALEQRVTFDEEMQRRMDAVRPLQARLDAAEAREQRLRNVALETLHSNRTRQGHKDCRENDCTLTALRAALATEGEHD